MKSVSENVKRIADVETVFAGIKFDSNFKRFMHTTREKAELEFGLHALPLNSTNKNALK